MGSTLTRDNRKMNKDGTTHFTNVPTLTIGGTKDGLMRISRIAETWYHARENIESAQDWMFPTIALEGVSHMGFMSGTPPSAVLKRDLKPEVSEEQAHQMIAKSMSDFIEVIIHKDTTPPKQIDSGDSEKILQPLLEAMHMEGFYKMKPPCGDTNLINRVDDPTCLHGSPWSRDYTQKIMGGIFKDSRITIVNDDNFHMV